MRLKRVCPAHLLMAGLLTTVLMSVMAQALQYTPPLRGAPDSRVGGGTRGDSGALEDTFVLAPNHTGWTIDEAPVLYWYTFEDVTAAVEVSLVDDRQIEPLLELKLDGALAGLHAISLSENRVALEPDIEYAWYVAIVADPSNRSKDVVRGGTILRVEPASELRSQLAGADLSEQVQIFAQEGLWYNAIGTLSELLSIEPGDGSLKSMRAALLEQVELPGLND